MLKRVCERTKSLILFHLSLNMVQFSHSLISNLSSLFPPASPKKKTQLKLPQARQQQQNNHNDNKIIVQIRDGEYTNVNSSGAKKSIRRVHI